MSNLSDKDLDGLSRDAAEFYEPDSSMLSWQRLEQHLIEQIPERPPDIRSFFRTRPLIWAPAVLILTGITYFFIKNTAHNKISTLNAKTQITSPKQTASPISHTPASSQDAGNQPAPADATTAGSAVNGRAATGSAANPAQANSGVDKNLSADDAGKAGTVQQKLKLPGTNGLTNAGSPGSASTGKNKNNKLSGGRNWSNGSKNEAVAVGKGEANETATAGQTAAFLPTQNQMAPSIQDRDRQGNDLSWLSPGSFNSRPVVRGNDSSLNRFAGAKKEAGKPSKALRINRSLSIGLVMGPDYSHVDRMASDQLGNNLGITVGYYLSSRLSLNTGIQYTIKDYWTGGRNFQPQPASTTSPAYAFPRIESVNGSLKMIEIPLTLRFDFLRSERSRLFVNAGLSSYLLRKESYTLFFHNAGRSYEWPNESHAHENYWMGVGSFSAGLEQDLGKGFSFQAEPFLRLPFHGIGVGDVRLNSYGMLFSIRYTPVLGKTRK